MGKSRLLVLAFSLLVAATLLGGVLHSQPRTVGGDAPYPQLQVLTEVMQHINDDYVTEPDMNAVADGALHGLLESLDADSSYLNPAEYQAYLAAQKQPAQATVGAVFAKRLGYAAVVQVRPGSPADQAGLVRGDFMETLGDKSTRDLSIAEINRAMAGPAGSTVTVGVVHMHKSDPVKITVTRKVLAQATLGSTLNNGVGVITVPDFNTGRSAEIANAVRDLTRKGATGIVLDLRDCADGSFTEAELTANLFLNKGMIDWLEGQKYPRVTASADAAKAIDPTAPVEVLVDTSTSGPAELAAAALAGNGRADTVGDHTFGEGAVQKIVEVGDGSAVLLSVARYYSPKGAAIEDGMVPTVPQVRFGGALPDEDFAPEGVNPASMPDLQLQKAIDLIKNPKATPANG